MTINVLLMILTFAIGPGTSQSIERSTATVEANRKFIPGSECYVNGTWYNPCPFEPETPPPSDPPGVLDQQ